MTTKSVSAKDYFKDILFLMVGLGLFYAIWLGSHSLFTPDEGRYSEVAREMLASGDFITPRLNGVVFLDKPIFYYWLQASAIYLFGLNEWALRVWPALVGVLCCIMTYLTGHILFNRRTGILAAVILSTSPLFYGAAHYANLDLEVASFVSISLMSFIIAMQVNSSSLRNLFLFMAYTFSAFAMLTKGLIGIAFPALIIGAWIVLSGRWNTFKKMRLFSGLVLFCLIALPWYVLVQKANPEFFDFFFVKQQVWRFLTKDHFNNRTPVWFYVPILLCGLFPWCMFVIQAFALHLKKIWQNRVAHSGELYLLLWFALIFTFFSIPKSKTIGYILPVFPAYALILGKYLSDRWNSFSRGIQLGAGIFVIVGFAGALMCFCLPYTSFEYQQGVNPYLMLSGILYLTATVIVGILLVRKNSPSMIILTLLISSVLFLLTVSASSHVVNDKTVKPLAIQIRPNLQANDEVVSYFKFYYDLPLYLERRITVVADWTAKDILLRDNWVREIWYGMPYQDTKDYLINEEAFWQRWNSDKRLYVFTDLNRFKTLQKNAGKPIYKVAEYNDTILVSNKPA